MARFTLDRAAIASIPNSPEVAGRMAACANAIKTDAQALTPVDTGFLKSSAFVDGGGTDYTIGYEASYAKYVEFGTRYMNAEPYLTPAAFKYRGSI